MRIALLTSGSRGDVQPYIGLAVGLKKAGYDVFIAAPKNFSDFVAAYGVEFYPLSIDWKEFVQSDDAKAVIEQGNVLKSLRLKRRYDELATQMNLEAEKACRGAGVILFANSFPIGYAVSLKLHIPCMEVALSPITPTKQFSCVISRKQNNEERVSNFIKARMIFYIWWQIFRKSENRARGKWGLDRIGIFDFNDLQKKYRVPLICPFSQVLVPKPSDWPGNIYEPGYWFLEDSSDWQPSPELQKFLDAGEKPVYIGFGSMPSSNPERDMEIIGGALKLSGQRGVVLSGWRNLDTVQKLPENMFITQGGPYNKLLPHMSAIVHHGGAGTTSMAFHAGIPSIIVPHVIDQFFWGERVYREGAGPEPIYIKELTAEKLAKAIRAAVENKAVREKAKQMGDKIRSEDAIGDTIRLIENLVGGRMAKAKAARI